MINPKGGSFEKREFCHQDCEDIRLTSWYSKYPIIYDGFSTSQVVGLGISEPSTGCPKHSGLKEVFCNELPTFSESKFDKYFTHKMGPYSSSHKSRKSLGNWGYQVLEQVNFYMDRNEQIM